MHQQMLSKNAVPECKSNVKNGSQGDPHRDHRPVSGISIPGKTADYNKKTKSVRTHSNRG